MNTCYVVRYATGGYANLQIHEVSDTYASAQAARNQVARLRAAGYAASAYRAARLFTVTDGVHYLAEGGLVGKRQVMTECVESAEGFESVDVARDVANEMCDAWCQTRGLDPANRGRHRPYGVGPVITRKLARIA